MIKCFVPTKVPKRDLCPYIYSGAEAKGRGQMFRQALSKIKDKLTKHKTRLINNNCTLMKMSQFKTNMNPQNIKNIIFIIIVL